LNPQGICSPVEKLLHPGGESPPGLFVCFFQNLVVDIGDVPDHRDLISAVAKPPTPQVVDQRTPKVAYVGLGLHGRTTDIHRDTAWNKRSEVDYFLGQRIVKPNRHNAMLSAGLFCSRLIFDERDGDGSCSFTPTRQAKTICGGRGDVDAATHQCT